MPISNPSRGENCSTLGVDARSFESFAALTIEDDELIVYDTEHEAAWIQSDVYAVRNQMV